MSDIEPAARDQLLHESINQGCLRRPVEVDHHVTAEDRVERALERPGLQEIELPKGNEGACHLTQSNDRSTLALGGLEITAIGLWHIVHRIRCIFPVCRLSEHVRIDIGCENADVTMCDVTHLFLQDDRD